MRIALSCRGIPQYGIQLADALSRRGHSVLAIYSDRELRELLQIAPSYLERGRFSSAITRESGTGVVGQLLSASFLLAKILCRRCELLHLTAVPSSLFLHMLAGAAWKLGMPIVCTLHDPEFHPGDIKHYKHFRRITRTLAMAEKIIVHGPSLARRAAEVWSLPRELFAVVPHGNYDIYCENAPVLSHDEQQQPLILFFGRMKKYKGLPVLLDAARIIARQFPAARIVLAGTGDDLERNLETCRSIPNVEVRNRYIPWSEGAALFAESALVVLPYTEASQSGPLAIAQSFGKAIVASSVGAIPEALEDEKDGLLVNPGDPHELAAALLWLLRNQDERIRLGAAARFKACNRCWNGSIVRETVSVYESVLNHGRRPRADEAKAQMQRMQAYYESHVVVSEHQYYRE